MFRFLVVLIFWVGVLFAGFGLLAARNATAIASLLVGALSVAGAVFLVLELSQPYGGVLQLSPAGLENALATRFWSAVKTGTSKDMRDNWCVGYSGRFTVGVWVGNFSGASMHDVTGITGAAPVWLDVMNHLDQRFGSDAIARPAGVTSRIVEFPQAVEPPREEWFVAGTEPKGLVHYPPRREF